MYAPAPMTGGTSAPPVLAALLLVPSRPMSVAGIEVPLVPLVGLLLLLGVGVLNLRQGRTAG